MAVQAGAWGTEDRMSWRERSATVIRKVLEETKGQPKEVVDKALFDAYPFGPRQYHPYKIWLSEIQVQRFGKGRRGTATRADLKKLQDWEAVYGKRTA